MKHKVEALEQWISLQFHGRPVTHHFNDGLHQFEVATKTGRWLYASEEFIDGYGIADLFEALRDFKVAESMASPSMSPRLYLSATGLRQVDATFGGLGPGG